MTSTAAPAARRRSPMARIFADRQGNLRAALILGLIAGALVILALGGVIAMLMGARGADNAVATWVVGAFIAIKLPLLGLVWWILGRRRERGRVGGWDSGECTEILEYLEGEARRSMGRADAPARLAYFSREAWFVANAAADADTAAAIAVATRIDALAAEVGVDTAHTRATAMQADPDDGMPPGQGGHPPMSQTSAP